MPSRVLAWSPMAMNPSASLFSVFFNTLPSAILVWETSYLRQRSVVLIALSSHWVWCPLAGETLAAWVSLISQISGLRKTMLELRRYSIRCLMSPSHNAYGTDFRPSSYGDLSVITLVLGDGSDSGGCLRKANVSTFLSLTQTADLKQELTSRENQSYTLHYSTDGFGRSSVEQLWHILTSVMSKYPSIMLEFPGKHEVNNKTKWFNRNASLH